ncbi:MAG: flagellar brake protein [Thiobacillus sp.]|nr:flagellar brake protein [Thiobacillus sp.]
MSDDATIPFDDLALQPGVMLQIHSALEVTGDYLPVGLLGYLRNQTLIVTNPITAGKVVPVREGTHFNVKGFSGTAHFTFKAKVVKVHAQPYPHMHLEYPRLVNSTQIRQGRRVMANLPATLFNPFTRKTTQVTLKDLSIGGGLLVLPEAIVRKDDAYTLSFRLALADDLQEDIKTDIVVRALDTLDDKGTPVYTMGVQFKGLDKLARLLIMAFVYR